MHSRGQRVLTAVVTILIGLFTVPLNAHADTYEFFDLGPDTTGSGSVSVYGITASGTVVLVDNLNVGVPQCANSGICTEYQTFINGVMTAESPTPPSLVYDDGTPCAPTTSFATTVAGPGVCNNGHEVYTATPAGSGPPTYGSSATFDGPDITDILATSGTFVSEVDLNSSGDFAYDLSHAAAASGELAEAIDLSTAPTPEPGTLALLATALLGTGTLRDRMARSRRRTE